MKQIQAYFIAAGFLLVGGGAFAHGEEDHHKPGSTAAHEGHASALGQPGDPKQVGRNVEITMSDAMRFSPARVSVQRGETIRFVLKNEGRLKHEMVLGTMAELTEHAALMRRFPSMEHVDPNQASVEPGQTGELIWQFTKAGTFDFACLQAGHYDAGMKGQVVVDGALRPSKINHRSTDIVIAQAPSGDLTDGEVRKIDRDNGKVTLKHGEIRNLDMPGMTMVFVVRDKAMLDLLKAGDKVRFKAIDDGGKLTVTEIDVVK
ncbi:MAG: copper-binding protein [Rhizobacter sp.]